MARDKTTVETRATADRPASKPGDPTVGAASLPCRRGPVSGYGPAQPVGAILPPMGPGRGQVGRARVPPAHLADLPVDPLHRRQVERGVGSRSVSGSGAPARARWSSAKGRPPPVERPGKSSSRKGCSRRSRRPWKIRPSRQLRVASSTWTPATSAASSMNGPRPAAFPKSWEARTPSGNRGRWS